MQKKVYSQKARSRSHLNKIFHACYFYNMCIIIFWQITSPDPVQVLPFEYFDMPYLCMAVCFSLLMCVISAQQECWKAAVLFWCFHWKDSNINSKEKCQALTGVLFISFLWVGAWRWQILCKYYKNHLQGYNSNSMQWCCDCNMT